MPSPLELMLSIVFGSIGFSFFIYGRKQKKPVPFWCGVALMGYTFLVSGPLMTTVVGLALVAVPYFLRT